MGLLLHIFEQDAVSQPPCEHTSSFPADVETARLIPGSDRRAHFRPQKKTPDACDGVFQPAPLSPSALHPSIDAILPHFLRLFAPEKLGTALVDIAAICGIFRLAALAAGQPARSSILVFYLAGFVVFSIQEGLYGDSFQTADAERIRVVKVVSLTTLLTVLALSCSPGARAVLPLFLWSAMNVWGLCALRMCWRLVQRRSAVDRCRNALIVGNRVIAQSLTNALPDRTCEGRQIKEFLPEHTLRGPFGATIMSRLARRQCIDEVIVATEDQDAAQAAIHEARRNQLDVWLAPELFGTHALTFENWGGAPLVKVHQPQAPRWRLAWKRIADAVLAAIGLIAVSPLLLLIAVIIKLDSPGPVLYRAERIGCKGRRFICYKFRSMVRQADAEKEELRSRNERDGAFFKMLNDPRITRVGRFLRRYSLDELPQLWNVFVGDMSLVGPRPHPPDDVERYSIQNLQRLDFVPGITGLWQVTARQDPSFERCVMLDVEYIKTWSLRLDLRILWKTITAILQGSGA